jgi:predicted HNH restriction endonuclease
MNQIDTFEDVLDRGETAIALKTDGMYLDRRVDTWKSSWWNIKADAKPDKVIIYLAEGATGGQIYVGNFVKVVRDPQEEKSTVFFSQVQLAGQTNRRWRTFTKQNSSSGRVYLSRGDGPATGTATKGRTNTSKQMMPTGQPSEISDGYWNDPTEGRIFEEGATLAVLVSKHERSASARSACLAHHGHTCKVCGLDFAHKYGKILGEGFIHVHHLNFLSQSKGIRKVDPVTDLVPVCPNCHAMLHRGNITPEDLRGHLKQ